MTLPVEGERVTVFDEYDLAATSGVVARFDRLARFNRVLIKSGEANRRLDLPARGFFYVREVGASWEGLELGTHRSRVPVLGVCVKVRPAQPDDFIKIAAANRRRTVLALLSSGDVDQRVLERWSQEKVDAVLKALQLPPPRPMLTQEQVAKLHTIDCDMGEDCRCDPEG